MWRCPTCGRSFLRTRQTHSCRVVAVEDHFRSKGEARALFGRLLAAVEEAVGPCEVVALPCCLRLSSGADFLAVLPRRDRLEIRFALEEVLAHPRISASARISAAAVKHSVPIVSAEDIDDELLSWIRRAQALAAGVQETGGSQPIP